VTFKSHIVALNDALRHPSLACMRQFVGMFGAIREANQRATRAARHNTLPGGRITSPALPQVSDSRARSSPGDQRSGSSIFTAKLGERE